MFGLMAAFAACRDGGGADKKLKPANAVKVRHILCEKQSKVQVSLLSNKFDQSVFLASWSLCNQLPPGGCCSRVSMLVQGIPKK